jgi:hypothetical protein
LQSNTQGLKLPTVSIGSLTTFGLPLSGSSTTANAKGMYVYNTNPTTGEGIYVWDGANWLLVKASIGAKPVTGITISAAGGATSLLYNATLQLTAILTPADASNQAVTWGIAEGVDIASVDATGLVSGIRAGRAFVSATASNGLIAHYQVIITNPTIMTPMVIGSKTYNTFDYSGTIWMMENLAEGEPSSSIKTQYNGDGTLDPNLGTPPAAGARGYYYNVTGSSTACPSGWRLPTNNEAARLAEHFMDPLKSSQDKTQFTQTGSPGKRNINGAWEAWGNLLSFRDDTNDRWVLNAGIITDIGSLGGEFLSVRCVKM